MGHLTTLSTKFPPLYLGCWEQPCLKDGWVEVRGHLPTNSEMIIYQITYQSHKNRTFEAQQDGDRISWNGIGIRKMGQWLGVNRT